MTTEHTTTPRRIGRYQLLSEVGRGGMGTVYRAHDPNLDRIVALKVPHGLAGNKERFAREARAAARVLHPNVCPIFDVGEHDGEPFVVMAFVEGHSLTHHLQNGATLQVPDAVRIASEVLSALAAVHAAGIVHRDVKPGNVLLDPSGRVVLTDFGLAMPQGGTHLTSDGVIVGTPAYLAPEQAGGRTDEVGPHSDLYAVGVLLYRALAGRVPFEGTPAEVVAAVLRDEPPSPRQFRPDVDLALEAIVLKAMAKKPGDRFPDANGFAAALLAYAGTFQPKKSVEETTALVPALPEARPAGFAWGRWLGWGIGLALTALVGFMQAYGFHEAWATKGEMTFQITVGSTLLLLLTLSAWWLAEVVRWPAGVRFGASWGGWPSVVRAAAANRVDLDEPNELGETPLMLASAAGHEAVVKVLLLNGARVDRVNSFGQTAADVAHANGRAAIYDLLHRSAGSPRQPRPPATQTRPRVLVLLTAALYVGTLAYVLLAWWFGAWPARLEWQEARGLLDTEAAFPREGHKHPPRLLQPPGLFPKQPPDLLCEVEDPSRHPSLRGGRFFFTTPPPLASQAEETQWGQQLARWEKRAQGRKEYLWPPRAPAWWPALGFANAGLLTLLVWLFGLNRLFGLLPRRAEQPRR